MKVVIQGAGRGIGLALAKKALASGASQLFLTARDPEASSGFAELPPGPNTTWLALDNLDAGSIAASAKEILAITKTVDRVICCAGILKEGSVAPEKRIQDVDANALSRVYQVNAIGPLLLAKGLFPALCGGHTVHFASLSARVGSISDNHLGGWYAYRASKAAQNQLMRTLSIELRRHNANACVATLHPGTVDTGLSKPFQRGVPDGKLFTPEFSAGALWSVLDGLGPEDTGGFFAFDGAPIQY